MSNLSTVKQEVLTKPNIIRSRCYAACLRSLCTLLGHFCSICVSFRPQSLPLPDLLPVSRVNYSAASDEWGEGTLVTGTQKQGKKIPVSTVFITNIKKTLKRKKSLLVLQQLSPSCPHLLTHFLRASSKHNMFTAVFTENNQCQGRQRGGSEGTVLTVQEESHRVQMKGLVVPQ